ncbi:MAG TPA: ABC transporter ATP-binding protein, partial [Acholeplasma sp.]|nr:ABC transporter ATP-binding protein [Acholeplasma sp.]
MILVPILVVIEVIFEILIPVFMSRLIDDGIKATAGPNKELIFLYGGLMVVSAIIALIFGVMVTRVTAKVSTEFGHNLRQAQFEKIQEYSFENIDNFKTSSLITRMTMDVNMIQQATNMILRVALRSPSLIIFSIISIMLFAPRLSLAFVISAPILIIGFIVIMRIAYKHFMRMFKRLDNLNLTIQEDLIAIRTVKSFTREGYEVDRFN